MGKKASGLMLSMIALASVSGLIFMPDSTSRSGYPEPKRKGKIKAKKRGKKK